MIHDAPAVRTVPLLAVDGGNPIRDTPLPPWPYAAEDEIQTAVGVLRSGRINYWTGTQGQTFEREFADLCGVRYGIALANGTVSLELALYAMGIGPGDEVIVPCRTFFASASAVAVRGAVPVMADIDRDSQTITAATVRAAMTSRTRAIIAVHLAGWPCDMDPILELARAHKLRVIEDCAQAHGAFYKRRPVGSFGDAGAFSFCQDKIMTTAGEGGMLVMNDEDLWRRCWSYKDHGKDYDAMQVPKSSPEFRWVHHSFGTNWRLTEVQSALGRAVLPKLAEWVGRRRAHAAYLNERMAAIPSLRLTIPSADTFHAYYKYYVFVRPERLKPGWTRDRIVTAISAEGIPCSTGHCGEIYLEKAFDSVGRPAAPLPVARELFETALMFQVHPTMESRDAEDTGAAIEKVMRHASAG